MYHRAQIAILHVPNAGPPCEGVAAENTSFTEFELDSSSSLSSLLRFLLFVVAIWAVVKIREIYGSKVEQNRFSRPSTYCVGNSPQITSLGHIRV
jgi:hypothetical protein